MSALAKRLIEENLKTKKRILDLGNCGLNGTEQVLEQLAECVHLETLIFSSEWVELGLNSLKSSKNTSKENYLKVLPNGLPPQLHTLIVGGYDEYWEITDLQPLAHLKQLKVLNLSANQLSEVGLLAELEQLEELNLSSNEISDIQPLAGLRHLSMLNLNQNQSLNIDSLAGFGHLRRLYLNRTHLSGLQPLAGLNQLTHLYLNTNKLTDISPLAGLNQLETLYLSENELVDISVLENFTKLEVLHLEGNEIASVVPLAGLKQLDTLNLTKNKVADIAPLNGLKNLKIAYLGDNNIQEVTLDLLVGLPGLSVLRLTRNPLRNIPEEFWSKGMTRLRKAKDYLQSIEEEANQRELNEAKLIFVGVGEVGKTELAEAISNEDYTFVGGRETTRGIGIKQWYPKGCKRDGKEIDFTANIWDFAGQEINYGTHQFFLTKNSVYIFVWETRKGEDKSEFSYWLNIVSLLSERAPVLVVQNKTDIYKGQINQQNWQQVFPNIVDFHETSCKEGTGIAALRDMATRELLKLPKTREIWNKNRFAVRETLEAMSENYISRRKYLQICEQKGLTRETAGFLGERLHDIGVILHFHDDIDLKNTVVLKPEWVTEAAYCLLDSKVIEGGKFNDDQLDSIWIDDRFDDKHSFLLRMMERFELIFDLDKQGNYIVPELLPAREPSHLSQHTQRQAGVPLLRFEYHYKFMPKGIMSRFICRIHQHIVDELFWRDGVVLHIGESQALISFNEALATKVITIKVWGNDVDKLLYTIRSHFEHIHRELNDPPLVEKIPCYCKECQTPGNELHIFRKKTLENNLKGGVRQLVCDNGTLVSVQQLLEGVLDVNNQHIKEFTNLINEGDMVGFFDKANALGIKEYQLSEFFKMFETGNTSHNFDQKLKIWVRSYFR